MIGARTQQTNRASQAEPRTQANEEAESKTVSAGRVASSAFWRAVETAGSEGVAFIVFAVLARFLSPKDFGAVAIVTSIMQILQCLLYNGFTEALIQKPDTTPEHHNTVSATNFMLSLTLIALGTAVAWPLGYWLDRSNFPLIFCVMLPSLIPRGLSSPMLASLRRAMDFRSIALRTLLGVICGGVMAVMLARAGIGYWALIANQWSSELIGFLVLAASAPAKPWHMRFSRRAFKDLVPVALPVMSAAFLSIAARRLDNVALGAFLPDRVIGIYFMANRLVFAAQMVTQHGLADVAMVILSNLNTDKERYRVGVLRAMRLMTYLCACAFGMLAVAGPWLVPLLFGASWEPATAPLRVLAATQLGGAVVAIVGITLIASGNASQYSRLAVGMAFAQLVAVAVAARWGLMAVAWGAGIVQCLAVLPALRMASVYHGLSLQRLLAVVLPILLLFGAALTTAYWIGTLGQAWYVQPLAAFAFALVMASAVPALLRGDKSQRNSIVPGPATPHA